MLKKTFLFVAILCGLLSAGNAFAIPVLQLYIEGATYDAVTDTWVVAAPSGPFTLWVIGNIDGPGGMGTIEDVMLTAAYSTSEEAGGSISLTPTVTGGFGGFTDPSTPFDPDPPIITGGNEGDVPILADGSPLERHGVFGPGTSFFQWSLGDFDTADSPIGDFISSFPTASIGNHAQINAYEVAVSGFTWVHFDAFNHVESQNHSGYRYVFAPYSHDAEAEVPEPGTLALLGAGMAGLIGTRLRRK